MTLRILIADDEAPARYAMRKALASGGYEIDEVENGSEAVVAIQSGVYDLVFLDLAMPEMDGKSVLAEVAPTRLDRATEIIVVTADDNVQTAVECIRRGASDYLNKPYEVERVRAIARRAAERIQLQRRANELQRQCDEEFACGALIGVSRPMQDLFARMRRVASAAVDVLIQGETGTGKELIARQIHELSSRNDGPFVAVNTAAITESLTESELFGHVKGAFTGADADRVGFFQQADGGTVFLDEIGDMPAGAQAKILRVLQQRVVQPVGTTKSIPVDVRVISATHQDLEQAMADGHFRKDLFYRIKGVRLHVPPLRVRREDIILLANHFLDQEVSLGTSCRGFTPMATKSLLAHEWPGNVRELQQVVRAACSLCEGQELDSQDLQLTVADFEADEPDWSQYLQMPLTEGKSKLVEAYERASITRALQDQQFNVSAAARQLGIHRQNLQQKMSQLGIRREEP